MKVTVYAMSVPVALPTDMREAWLELLPYQRRLRCLRELEHKQVQTLCAYALLREMLRREYGLDELPAIEVAGEGKPYFPQYPQIHFNLSHTDGAALCAVSAAVLAVSASVT